MRAFVVVALVVCLASAGCGGVEADPAFLVVGVGETTYDINVVSGRPGGLKADNWHRSKVDKAQFATEVREGDHVVCHLVEKDAVEITGCKKVEGPPST